MWDGGSMGGCGSPESMPEQSGGVGSFLFFGGAVLVETCGVDMCIGLELENFGGGELEELIIVQSGWGTGNYQGMCER